MPKRDRRRNSQAAIGPFVTVFPDGSSYALAGDPADDEPEMLRRLYVRGECLALGLTPPDDCRTLDPRTSATVADTTFERLAA